MNSRDEALSALEDEIGVLIGRARRVVAERARVMHPDMQAGSYLILGFVRSHGPVRATAIGENFAIDKGSISRHVQQLIDFGLVSRAPDPHDGRAILLSATDEGKRRLDAITQARRDTFYERVQDWSTQDLASFAAALSRYNIALSDQ
ncbi:MAG: MarR family transcriptional regulator [Nocardioidaceae bacterium]|nr:MarR family transcriptional regulator [Nocardioidaceae bacterium]MCL2614008.1 MarR family transcriptional regulator [Nocardioidaceae bacterium]